MPFTPRSIAQIQTSIQQSVANNAVLATVLTSQSLVAYWILWTYIMAVTIAALEQIMLILWNELEAIVAAGVPATAAWIQAQVLLFEYGNVITLNADFTVSYSVPNLSQQIISQCAIVPNNIGGIVVKVATGSPPAPITTPQLNALYAYLTTILPPGMAVGFINQIADSAQVSATIYYNAQYPTISTDVANAINAYLTGIPFNGIVKLSALESAILAVPGVIDVVLNTVVITPYSGAPVTLVNNSEIFYREFQTVAGYIVSSNLSNSLTFTVATE